MPHLTPPRPQSVLAPHATFGGIISGGASAGITKTGDGTLALSGANSYTGETTVVSGTLIAASNTALGTAAGGTTAPW